MWQLIGPAGTITIILVILIISGVRILKEYQRGVIFRLGRMVAPRGPGITYVIPVIEKMTRVDLRTVTMDLPPQDVITKDIVSVKVRPCFTSGWWMRIGRFEKSSIICLRQRNSRKLRCAASAVKPNLMNC